MIEYCFIHDRQRLGMHWRPAEPALMQHLTVNRLQFVKGATCDYCRGDYETETEKPPLFETPE